MLQILKNSVVVSLGILSLQEAQADELQCMTRAKDVARKTYGNCLADLKSQEIKDLYKSYQQELLNLRQKHDQELAALKAERAQLRKGIIKLKKQLNQSSKMQQNQDNQKANQQTDTFSTPDTDLESFSIDLNESSGAPGNTELKSSNARSKQTEFSRKAKSTDFTQQEEVATVIEPQIRLKRIQGSEIKISPLENGNNIELPEPEEIN